VTRSVWAWVRLLGGAAIIALLMWRLGIRALGRKLID
jgi:hypothetical protein